jgi:iron(III) transport system ATP-binding protein
MAFVEINSLSKFYGEVAAVDSLDLEVSEGEFLCVLGPSGCGKTTLLRLIAGLETPDQGTLRFADELVWGNGRNIPSERRNVGVVFQSYALWPHMTVEANVGYPLRVIKLAVPERQKRVDQALATVRMENMAGRKPHELSGGQQQRVALARCLTQAPRIVLMDEPLANLDMHLRESMLEEFRRFHKASGATIIYITHDQAEAMSIADRIAIMFNGRLRQIATPEELYNRPADAEVAGFVGLSTLFKAVAAEGDKVRVNGEQHLVTASLAGNYAKGQEVLLGVRPEDIRLDEGPFKGMIQRAVYLGGRYLLEIKSDLTPSPIKAYANGNGKSSGEVNFRIDRSWVMPARAQG